MPVAQKLISDEGMVRELANDDLHDDLHFLVLEIAITCVIGHVCG